MKTPVNIAVTGAAGQISYSLLFRLAAGDFLGPDQPVNLSLLEIPPAMKTLSGIVMELSDCGFPLLRAVTTATEPETAFGDADYAFLIGAKPRKEGMLRSDLLLQNAEIFSSQGRALNAAAKREVKVLVTGNPANTNALIAIHNAPDLPASNFAAMTMLDHTRAVSQLAAKCAVSSAAITNVAVWGNHSCAQYPDLHHAKVNGAPALSLVDKAWYEEEFIPTVQYRGGEVIKARGSSSAGSAANAALQHMRALVLGTPAGDWASMALLSDGSYGVDADLVFSFPVQVTNGKIGVAQGLEINEFGHEFLLRNQRELREEREAIKHLL